MYSFTSFAMQLNELHKEMEGVIPQTDCRLRPDIRAMENGDIGEDRRCLSCFFSWVLFEVEGCEGVELASSHDHLSPLKQTSPVKRRRGWRKSREPHAKLWPSVVKSGRQGKDR